jgi:hypothetical protein
VDDTGNVTQDGQTDVDEQVGTTSALQEDTHGREDDGEDDLADVAAVLLVVELSQEWYGRIRVLTHMARSVALRPTAWKTR